MTFETNSSFYDKEIEVKRYLSKKYGIRRIFLMTKGKSSCGKFVNFEVLVYDKKKHFSKYS